MITSPFTRHATGCNTVGASSKKSQILKSFFQYFLIFGTSLKVDRAFVGINKHTKKPVAVKGLCQFQGADRDAVKAALGNGKLMEEGKEQLHGE